MLRNLIGLLVIVVLVAGGYVIYTANQSNRDFAEVIEETMRSPMSLPGMSSDKKAAPELTDGSPPPLAEEEPDQENVRKKVRRKDTAKQSAKKPTAPTTMSPPPSSPPPEAMTIDQPPSPSPPPAPTGGGAPESRKISGPDNASRAKKSARAETPATEEATEGGSPPPETAEEVASEDEATPPENAWDVVPVYYGTDRAQAPTEKHLDYSSQRGRRLELGRALVTVPKAHQAPAIERPWALRVPYLNVTLYQESEDPEKHFTLKSVAALTEDEFLKLVQERLAASKDYKDHALIFIHGYNTTFEYAIYRSAQISYDLKFDGASFAYSWPSGGGLASYTYDRESAAQAEPYLRKFIDLVAQKSGAKSVSIIAHSMGNQVALRVLRDINRQSNGAIKISQIILAAPDVDRDAFANIAREIDGLAEGVTLYAAANDRALQVSRNFNGGIPRAGDVPEGGPLILSGVDTVDATAASMDSLGLNHSGYAESNEILKDIGRLIKQGVRPPSTRTPALRSITTDQGTYWRYPN